MVFDIQSPNYVPKSYEDIFNALLIKALAWGLLSDDTNFESYVNQTMDIENTMIIDFSVISLILSYVYNDVTRVKNALDPDSSTGTDLDNILKLYLDRILPSYAVGTVNIDFGGPAGIDFTIPAGTVLQTQGDRIVQFVSTPASILVTSTMDSVDVDVRCTEYGPVGNVLAHDIDLIVSPMPVDCTVDNFLNFTGGSDYEDDDHYKGRGRVWKYSLVKGTYDSYKDALNSIPAVTGWNLDRWWRGYGTTKVVIDPPTNPVIALVTAAIELVKAVDEDITISPVELVTIDTSIIANVTIDETVAVPQSIKDDIAANIKFYTTAYINGGLNADGTVKNGLTIGDDYIPFLNDAYVLSQESRLKNVEVLYPTDPITIGQDQRAVAGEITVEVV